VKLLLLTPKLLLGNRTEFFGSWKFDKRNKRSFCWGRKISGICVEEVEDEELRWRVGFLEERDSGNSASKAIQTSYNLVDNSASKQP
jgi:hypothetical protein